MGGGRGKPSGSSDKSAGRPTTSDGKSGAGRRDKSTVERLKMYRSGKPIRDKKGRITGGDFMAKDRAGNAAITASTGRVQPDRRWFGNTRVAGQEQLDAFRDAMAKRSSDPYSIVLNRKKLPMGLLTDMRTAGRAHLLESESFGVTFGPRAQRKRVRLPAMDESSYASMAAAAEVQYSAEDHVDRDLADGEAGERSEARHAIFDKGSSKRIWGELYKVLDCSDVVVQVLDARNPAGTRSSHVEKYLREHAGHKHLVFVLNKCDLVPTWVTRRWVATLSQEYPTLAFHASMTHPFGKGALIALLRQFSRLHGDKKSISVGFIGYPNVGKSSIINALNSKKVCSVAPIPGETKVWQFVTLMKRVFLIDCPGVVYPSGDSEADIVLKGVVRSEKLGSPEDYVDAILARVKKEYMTRVYGVEGWTDGVDFMTKLAVKGGRLLKGGEPDLPIVARMIINDWQRGKLPYYSVPPESAAVKALAAASASAADAAPLIRVEQVIPRLGAHALLAEDEEEADRGQVPATGDMRDAEEGADDAEDAAVADDDAPPAEADDAEDDDAHFMARKASEEVHATAGKKRGRGDVDASAARPRGSKKDVKKPRLAARSEDGGRAGKGRSGASARSDSSHGAAPGADDRAAAAFEDFDV